MIGLPGTPTERPPRGGCVEAQRLPALEEARLLRGRLL